MRRRTFFIFLILIIVLIGLMVLNLMSGSTSVTLGELHGWLFGSGGDDVNRTIILGIRMPRIVAACLLGGALSLSGYLLQTFFSNPIAGPFVLGISSGAKLLVACLMVGSFKFGYRISSLMMVAAAFAGALVATMFVLAAAGKVRSMAVLVVCGVMISYICSAITELLVSFAEDSNIVNLHNWSMGSFSGIDWSDVRSFVPVVLCSLLVSFLLAKGMEAYSYGEEYAMSLGMNVKRFRIALILVSSVLSATVTAFAGPISFVGIAVPHVVRSLFKTTKPLIVIPASFLAGAGFCLFSDLIARSLFAPAELSISTITAIFGAPVVISMMLGRRRGLKCQN